MAQLDAGIYSNALARQRSAQDYTNDYIRTAGNAMNMLAARQQMQDAAEQRTQQNALAQLMAGGFDRKAPDAMRRVYQVAPMLAPGVIKGFAEQDKAAADIETQNANAERSRIETQNKAMDNYRSMLAGVRDPQTAVQWIRAGYADPVLGPVLTRYAKPDEAAQRIPQDPAAFQQWLQAQAVGATKFVELNKPQTVVRNTGGSTDVIQTPGLGGPATVVSSVKNTQSPDNAASVGASLANAAATREVAKATRDAANIQTGFKNEQELRKEFENLPEVKSYKKAYPAYASIKDAASRNTPQSDINIVYGVAKLYDPDSVVREGEYGTIANSQAIPEWLKGAAQRLAGGGRLTAETRRQIMTEANGRIQSYQAEHDKARASYEGIATRRGINPANVFQATGDVPGGGQPAPPKPAAGPVKVSTDADYAKLPSGAEYIAPDGSHRRKK